jgi:hypothetical protein
MATYVNDLRLKEIATGDESGTWGTSTNTNLELIAEAFSFGTEAITTNADTHTTTIADGSTDPGRSIFLKYTGTLDSACTITIGPNTVSKMWFIENGTSGSQNIIISQGSGANITIPPGDVKVVYSDGAGSGAAVVDAFASLSVVDLKVQDDLTVTDDMTVGGTLGVTGVLTATSLDISGDIDVDGTTNLDVVDIDGAVDMASTLQVDGAITSSAGATITIADNSAALTVKSTDADSANGPIIDLIRDSASPADSDSLGMLRFKADNDAGEETIVANIKATVVDVSDGSEDGRLLLQTMIDGTSRNRIEITNTEVVVNQSSVDSDFRVESDNFTHAFFVQASDGNVGIGGASAPAFENGNGLEIRNPSGNGSHLKLTDNASGTGATQGFDLYMFNSQAYIENYENAPTIFRNNGGESMRIDSGGRVMIAETSNSGYSATADDLIVGDNGSSTERGISLGSTAGSTIRFNDGADAGLIEYAHSDNSMRLYTAATERMRIDSSGRVGIAQDTPGDFNAAADDLVIGNSGGDFGMTIRTGTSSNGSIHFADGTSGDAENEGIITYDHSDDHMHFSTSASERMRIDSSGNVGIGDNSPDSRLHLTTGSSAILRMQRSNNIFGFESGSTASGGYGLYDYAASAYDLYLKAGSIMVGTTTPVGKAHFSQSGLDSDVLQLTNSNSTRSFGQRITFSTDHNDTTSKFLVYKGNTTDRLVIYSNGNIQNTNNSYGALSDEKLKENIVDATDKLEDLKQVKIRNYNFIGEDKNQIGVIAQELETIFPSMVEDIQDQDAEGNLLETSTKSVKYSVFVPILIKAIQEQQTIIDDLKTRIETLEG